MTIRTVGGYDFLKYLLQCRKRSEGLTQRLQAFSLWNCGPVVTGIMYGSVLFTISAEDCYGIVTGEIEALWQGHEVVNKKATEPKGVSL